VDNIGGGDKRRESREIDCDPGLVRHELNQVMCPLHDRDRMEPACVDTRTFPIGTFFN
jgi:hypothetical protein